MSDEILHRQEGRRGAFTIERGGKRLAEQTYTMRQGGKVASIEHTEVDESLRGQGIARKLTVATVEWARGQGLKILPLCPFAKAVIERDESLQDVLAQA
ncbi:MAG TPA: GNAT family N-acetyltransferase [Myxococcales bacterium]|nr:GNAT family N-acetyltransferase [Myxococcales bacterium]